jgi:hypothetical protein
MNIIAAGYETSFQRHGNSLEMGSESYSKVLGAFSWLGRSLRTFSEKDLLEDYTNKTRLWKDGKHSS